MPWFKLHRTYALSTTKGHSVNFKKGERTWVPQALIQDALGIGAVPEDEKILEEVVPETPQKIAIDAEKRKQLVFEAFEKLLLRAARGDFQASGMPHPKKLEEILGFDMSQKEREALWHEYQTMKADEAQQ